MAMYFSFDLASVYRNLLYRDAIEGTRSRLDIGLAIEEFRETIPRRERRSIPH
jgi:hypothetical protein